MGKFNTLKIRGDRNIMHSDEARINAVIEFCDHVLENGRDRYRDEPTPLFCDGINIDTLEPIKWHLPGTGEVIISNMATQQYLFRTLTALSYLLDDASYKNAAMDAIRYHFNHLVDESGLLHWGGHKFIDLKTLEDVGPKEKGYVHELKNCFPYYELMRSEEHTSELQSRGHLVCRLLLEKKNTID